MQIDLFLRPLFPGGLFEGHEDLVFGNGEAADVEVLAARPGDVFVPRRACYGESDGADCGSAEIRLCDDWVRRLLRWSLGC